MIFMKGYALPAFPLSLPLSDGQMCTIRPLDVGDAEACCSLLPKLHKETDFLNWSPGEFNLTVEQERGFISTQLAKPGSMAVAALVADRIVGLAGAWSPEHKKFQHHAELGISILKAYWGLGIGGRMMQLILDWGAAQGLHKIYLHVFSDNHRAHKWYLSLGFIEEARLKNDIRRADGSFSDTIIMARYF